MHHHHHRNHSNKNQHQRRPKTSDKNKVSSMIFQNSSNGSFWSWKNHIGLDKKKTCVALQIHTNHLQFCRFKMKFPGSRAQSNNRFPLWMHKASLKIGGFPNGFKIAQRNVAENWIWRRLHKNSKEIFVAFLVTLEYPWFLSRRARQLIWFYLQ